MNLVLFPIYVITPWASTWTMNQSMCSASRVRPVRCARWILNILSMAMAWQPPICEWAHAVNGVIIQSTRLCFMPNCLRHFNSMTVFSHNNLTWYPVVDPIHFIASIVWYLVTSIHCIVSAPVSSHRRPRLGRCFALYLLSNPQSTTLRNG